MSPPKKPPVSLRLSDELIAEVAAFAGKRKITRNAAYALLIRDGLRWNGPSLPSPERQAEIKAYVQARQARQARQAIVIDRFDAATVGQIMDS